MMIGLVTSVVLFLCALQSGQFSDQARARYLPLVGEKPAAGIEPPAQRERLALMVLFVGALLAFLATFIVAILKR